MSALDLHDEFRPSAALRNPHLQSLLASIKLRQPLVMRKAADLLATSEEVILDCGDGVRLMGEYTAAAAGRPRGLAVLIHGWEGSSGSLYILSSAARLHAAGYDIFRLNLRDHGGTHHLNPELFHSCRLDETVAAVQAIAERWPGRRLFLAGFSLGGNFALRIARRAPAAGLSLEQVVAVCPVLDPGRTMAQLEQGWVGYRMYFLRKWRRSLLIKQACFPELYDFGNLRELPTLTATTEYFVRRYTEFPDAETYLNGYSITGGALAGLEVPSRIITAVDDPVIPSRDLSRLARSDALELLVTPAGGHCGFVADWRLESWVDSAILAAMDTGR
ncbi:MAG: alpha/beta fold hydrolase [Gammaproteobacteria bacterium]|nr:alpha/beta fold hydrolase [Gammaproteobacteria bacterium]TVQ50249.1 MAG: alpha/beta fold hydrolase [Gammaproteobacteria bacterium]